MTLLQQDHNKQTPSKIIKNTNIESGQIKLKKAM